jgi:hypothetical protein
VEEVVEVADQEAEGQRGLKVYIAADAQVGHVLLDAQASPVAWRTQQWRGPTTLTTVQAQLTNGSRDKYSRTSWVVTCVPLGVSRQPLADLEDDDAPAECNG